MLRAALIGLTLVSLTACTATGPRTPYGRFMEARANPGKVVATELAFARAAQEDGQWTAFRAFSTDDAVMFVPQAVNAHDWLKQQDDPPKAVEWQPHEVWSSCDGSLVVTKGAWQRADGTFGYFTTVWQRQSNGDYKWVLDQGDKLTEPLDAPEFVQTRVARCDVAPGVAMTTFERAAEGGRGKSADRSLAYEWAVMPDGARSVLIWMQTENGFERVLDIDAAAPE